MKRLLLLFIILSMLFTVACNNSDIEDEPMLLESDLVFKLDGNEFPLYSDAAKLREQLSGEYEMSEAVSCMFEGMDRTFDHGDIIITTVPDGDLDLMDEIYILDGDYTTTKGIGIGSKLQDVKAAYGDKFIDDGFVITYPLGELDDMYCPRLYFVYVDDTVVEFSFYDPSEVS